jgi:hypothetical protein
MKEHCLILAVFFTLIILSSCKDNNQSQIKSFSGKVQKGPYLQGSSVIAFELNEDFNQTGKSFTTDITSNDGSFSFSDIILESEYVLLKANGYYFSEIYGQSSPGTLTLYGVSDLSNKSSINVNLMTDVIKSRILILVDDGLSFSEANSQAKNEFLEFLGADEISTSDFDQLNIVEQGDENALLLAYSLITQRWTGDMGEQQGLTGELSELISKISQDFADNGEVNDPTIINQLLNNVATLNYNNIRINIQTRYTSLGITSEIPNFEEYIGLFQLKHDPNAVLNFTYPLTASPNPVLYPEPELNNLLHKETTEYQAYSPNSAYVVAAITPVGGELKIKIIPQTCSEGGACIINGGVNNGGWLMQNDGGVRTFTAQRQNDICTVLIDLVGTGSAIIEYYENNMETPIFTKTIIWEY